MIFKPLLLLPLSACATLLAIQPADGRPTLVTSRSSEQVSCGCCLTTLTPSKTGYTKSTEPTWTMWASSSYATHPKAQEFRFQSGSQDLLTPSHQRQSPNTHSPRGKCWPLKARTVAVTLGTPKVWTQVRLTRPPQVLSPSHNAPRCGCGKWQRALRNRHLNLLYG